MAGRINHRGWIVLESVASRDGLLCVDFFEDPEDGYGFEHFRTDPEDQGRWATVGNLGSTRYPSVADAAEAASQRIAWLASDARATRALDAWLAHLDSERKG